VRGVGRCRRGGFRVVARRGRGWLLVLLALGMTAGLVPLAPAASAQGFVVVDKQAVVQAGTLAEYPDTLAFFCPNSHPYLFATVILGMPLGIMVAFSSQQPGADPEDQSRLAESPGLAAVRVYPGGPGAVGRVEMDVANEGNADGSVRVRFTCADFPTERPSHTVVVQQQGSTATTSTAWVPPTTTVAPLIAPNPFVGVPSRGMQVDVSGLRGRRGVGGLQVLFCDWSGSGVDVPTVFDPVDGLWYVERAVGSSGAKADWVGRRFWPSPGGYPSDFWVDRLSFGSLGGDAPLAGVDDVGGCGDFTGLGHDQPFVVRSYAGGSTYGAYQQVFVGTWGVRPGSDAH
jgi:hypothetical protein